MIKLIKKTKINDSLFVVLGRLSVTASPDSYKVHFFKYNSEDNRIVYNCINHSKHSLKSL